MFTYKTIRTKRNEFIENLLIFWFFMITCGWFLGFVVTGLYVVMLIERYIKK